MMQLSYQWHGGERLAEIEAAGWEGLQRATVFLHTKILEALNVSNPRPYDQPSKPDEPPRKRTGWLQRNVLYELDRAAGVGKVGISTLALYGIYLELGTARLQARPWLLATAQKHFAALQALASGGKA